MKYLLAGYLREQARWRLDKAEEDERNARSAAALGDVAGFVEHLDDEDLRLLRIDAAYQVREVGDFQPGARGQALIDMWGFYQQGPGGSPESFLNLLVQRSEEDAVDFFRDFGEQVDEFFRESGGQDFE